ncbi:MAG: hypothetical protein PHE77_00620, partial [Candidatus Pacebacteria bacterium]|nr:hypothetical protein [Candidatus Paceibacterota bacterium]
KMGIHEGASLNAGWLFCWIDPEKAVDEWRQVFILIHEALHDHPKFEQRKPAFIDIELEEDISKEAVYVMGTCPDIVAYVTEQLRLAKILLFRESLVPYVSTTNILIFRAWVKRLEEIGRLN